MNRFALRRNAMLMNRWSKQEYDDLLDEFMMACKLAYGERVLVQVIVRNVS